jgi:hypothetical protein
MLIYRLVFHRASCPKVCRNAKRTELHVGPQVGFIPMSMQFLMVFAAKGHRKFVAYLSSKGTWPGNFQMMRVTWCALAD